MSTVPSPSLTPTGWIMPAQSDILTAVQNDINAAFGGSLSPGLSTPQGQLASSIAAIIGDKDQQFLDVVNQVDPLYSSGRMQDAIGYIYFMTRLPAIATSVVCTCTGLSGTSIPVNAQAKDTAGNLYICPSGGTIGGGGTVSLTFENVVPGPTTCPAGTLTKIYVQIPGWDTISNPADGVVGRDVETAQQFETRRAASVALNALNSTQSIYAAVFASGASLPIPNVPTDVYVAENTAAIPQAIGGVVIPAHSIYVSVVGGDDQSIANAIWAKKSAGCGYGGNTTVTVTDTTNPANPTYPVTFERPAALPIYFSVSITNNPSLPANIATLIQNAIITSWNNIHIGGLVYASAFYGAIQSADPNVQIVEVLVGLAPSPSGLIVPSTLAQYPTISSANIAVVLV